MNHTPKLLYIIFLILLTSCQKRVNYEKEKAHLENFCKYSEVLQFPFITKPVLYKGMPFTGMVYSKTKWEKKGYAGTFDMVEKYRFKEGRLEGKFLTSEGSYPFDSQGGGEMYTIQIKGRIINGERRRETGFLM